MPFNFIKLEIPNVILVKPKVFTDDRGFFLESFKSSDFIKNGINIDFVQDNHSKSKKNTLRGLHYQLDPVAQGKLIKCINGKIFDVAVDVRRNSKTFKKWVGIYLDSQDHNMLYIPPGFAHGFCTFYDNTEVLYKVTAEYSVQHDRGIIWNDPSVGIKWPLKNLILSEKDKILPNLSTAEIFTL